MLRFSSTVRSIAGQRLGNDADHAAHRVGIFAHIVAGDNGLAAGDRDQRRHHADERAFAGAVGAEQAEDLAVGHREGDALHGFKVAVALDDVFDRNRMRALCRACGPTCWIETGSAARHCFTSLLFGM